MRTEEDMACENLEAKTILELPQKALRQLIDRVAFAIPRDDPRRALLGAYCDVEDRLIKLVATDGKKMAFAKCEADTRRGQNKIAAIVPRNAIVKVRDALGEQGSVRIFFSECQVRFVLGHCEHATSSIDGTYPNYTLAIPKSFTQSILLPKGPLLALMRQAVIAGGERSHGITLHFGANELRLSSAFDDVGSFSGSLAVRYDQEPFDIVFNCLLLQEALDSIETEDVWLKTDTLNSPAMLCGKDVNDSFVMLMPIKLADLDEPD